MKRGLWKKGLVIGIIVLFVGAAIITAMNGLFSNINKFDDSNISNNEHETFLSENSDELNRTLEKIKKDESNNYQNKNTLFDHKDTTRDNDIVLDFSFEPPMIEKKIIANETYDRIIMQDLPNSDNTGEPCLPVQSVRVLLPQDHEVKSIDIDLLGKNFVGDGLNVKLGKKPVPISGGSADNFFNLNEEYDDEYYKEYYCSYENNGKNPSSYDDSSVFDTFKPFPTSSYDIIGTYSFRGYKILLMNLYPLHYTKDTGEVYYYNEMRVTVKTEVDKQPCSLFRGLIKDRIEVEDKVVNPEIINTYSSSPDRMQISSLVNPSDSYDYVIITSEKLTSKYGPYTFENLVDLKMLKGLNATIVNIEDISNESAYWNTTNKLFNDTQAQIRNFITDAYLNWGTDYVLLGGDGDTDIFSNGCIIPVRFLDAARRGNRIPSDVYYGCLDGNYNSDEDGAWGESTDGDNGADVDLMAEVYIGRASVDSAEELSNFVMKTIMYEYTNDEYLEKVLMSGENLGSRWGGDYKDEIINGSSNSGYSTVGIHEDIYNITTLYDRDWPGNNWPKSELIELINNGTHIINHMGHANPNYVMKLMKSDVNSLNNNNYCFIYSQGCDCGRFEYDDCIAESFTNTENGAFATIMNTRSGWIGPSQMFDRQFFDAIYGENITEIGKANQDSKEDSIGLTSLWRYCYYSINLLGDPEVSLKKPINLDHDLSVKNLDASLYVMPNVTFWVNATIINFGGHNETNVLVNFTVDGIVKDNTTISLINSSDTTNLSFNYSLALGIHKVGIEIQNVSNENITINNALYRTVICGPDVAITYVYVPLPLYINNSIGIGAYVKNLGENDLNDLNLTLKVDNVIIDNITIPTLSSGSEIYRTLMWIPNSSKWCQLTVFVDPVANESYTIISNNYYNNLVHPVNHTVYVDDDGDKDFEKINDALYWIGSDDTIIVYNGVYYDNLLIYKTIKLLGEDKDNTIIDGSSGITIYINAHRTNITGFTIQDGYTGIETHGNNHNIHGNVFSNNIRCIDLISSSSNKIIDNNITSCGVGIGLGSASNNNIIEGNNISNNSAGIEISSSSSTTITGNSINLNNRDGIELSSSSGNTITGNSINLNNDNGIFIASSSDTTITGNNICLNNGNGLYLHGSTTNNINVTGNNISSNNIHGIRSSYSNNNNVINNTIISNGYYGISLDLSSFYNKVTDNIISDNDYGVYSHINSNNNTVYHNNFINNTENAYEYSAGANIWDNGYPSGGNYWDDYTDIDNYHGPNQDIPGSDGIGDTSYNISSGNNQDRYPLMSQYGPPYADFTYSVNEMNLSLNASISYDYDGVITSYEWDFNDTTNATGMIIEHIYSDYGIYNITLTVTDDDNKTDSIVKTIGIENVLPEIIDNTPTTGYTSDAFTFNSTVTDNFQVSTVWIEYWYGTESHTNLSMNNVADEYWEHSIVINDTLEILHYFISANDLCNNWNNTNINNVIIYDNDNPVILNVQVVPSIQEIDKYVNITTTIIDNIEAEEVFLNISYPDSSFENFSITQNRTDDTYFCNKTYYQLGEYAFYIWTNDTSGNTNSSTINMFTIEDISLPEIFDNTPSTGYTSDVFTFNSTVTDNFQVSTVWIEYWYGTESHTNLSMNNVADEYWEHSIVINDTLDKLHYQIAANDTSNNWNNSTTKDINIYDNDAPIISNVQAIPSMQLIGGYVNVSGTVIDNIEVNKVYLNIEYPDNSIKNYSITQNKTGDTYYCYKTYDQLGIYTYHIWVNDTSHNTNISAEYTFEIIPNSSPIFGIPNPVNGSTSQPLSFTWQIPINDSEGDSFDWSIECNNDQTNSSNSDSNGTKSLSLSDLLYSTTYIVWVNATDLSGSDEYTREWFIFTTKENVPPSLGTPDPANESTNQPLAFTWSIPIYEPDDLIDWSIECSNGQSNSATNDNPGTKTCDLSGLSYSTTYKVWVNVTDGYAWVHEWFTFTTKDNNPPVFSDENPPDFETNIPVTITSLTIIIEDPEGDSFDWSIETSPTIGFSSGLGEYNATKTCGISGLSCDTSYTWYVNATDSGSGRKTEDIYTFTTVANSPPNIPEIDGTTSGKIGKKYYYNFSATDPDGHNVSYYIEWGDDEFEDWFGPYYSSEIINKSHKWSKQEKYLIKAKAKDVYGAESNWGYLSITMPKNHQMSSRSSSLQESTNPLSDFKIFQRLLNHRPMPR